MATTLTSQLKQPKWLGFDSASLRAFQEKWRSFVAQVDALIPPLTQGGGVTAQQAATRNNERSLYLTIRPGNSLTMMDHNILAAMLESRIKAAPAGSPLEGLPIPFPADQLTNDHIFMLIEEELAKENTNNGVGITSKVLEYQKELQKNAGLELLTEKNLSFDVILSTMNGAMRYLIDHHGLGERPGNERVLDLLSLFPDGFRKAFAAHLYSSRKGDGAFVKTMLESVEETMAEILLFYDKYFKEVCTVFNIKKFWDIPGREGKTVLSQEALNFLHQHAKSLVLSFKAIPKKEDTSTAEKREKKTKRSEDGEGPDRKKAKPSTPSKSSSAPRAPTSKEDWEKKQESKKLTKDLITKLNGPTGCCFQCGKKTEEHCNTNCKAPCPFCKQFHAAWSCSKRPTGLGSKEDSGRVAENLRSAPVFPCHRSISAKKARIGAGDLLPVIMQSLEHTVDGSIMLDNGSDCSCAQATYMEEVAAQLNIPIVPLIETVYVEVATGTHVPCTSSVTLPMITMVVKQPDDYIGEEKDGLGNKLLTVNTVEILLLPDNQFTKDAVPILIGKDLLETLGVKPQTQLYEFALRTSVTDAADCGISVKLAEQQHHVREVQVVSGVTFEPEEAVKSVAVDESSEPTSGLVE